MSKVYSKIKFDIETWKVLEEDSYEYDGQWAYCDGTSSSSSSISSSSFSCFIDADDDFTGSNGDYPNFNRWDGFFSGTGSSPIIFNNKLRTSITSGQGQSGVDSQFSFNEDDYDITVDFDIHRKHRLFAR